MKTNCPVCFQALNPSPQELSHLSLCSHCGWKESFGVINNNNNLKLQKKTQFSIIKSMGLAVLGFGFLVFHLSQWGGHSLSIVYLKGMQWSGLAGANQYKKLQNLCYKLKKYDCVESALESYYKSSQDQDVLKSLALFYMKSKKTVQALSAYETYFKHSFDPQSGYNYAGLLRDAGENQKALDMYNQIIAHKGESSLPVNVVRNKIHLLVSMNRSQEAMTAVKKYSRLVENSDEYLKQEIQNWEKHILNHSS